MSGKFHRRQEQRSNQDEALILCLFAPGVCVQLVPPALEDIIQCKPGAIEVFLHNLQLKMAKFKASTQTRSTDSGYPHNLSTSHEAAHSEDDYSPRVPTARPSNFYPQQLSSGGSPAGKGPLGDQSHHGRAAAIASHGDSFERHKNMSGERRRAQDLPGPTKAGRDALQREVDQEILIEKEETIQELRETVEILEMKMAKLEQLVRLKDAKIQRLNEELYRVTSGKGAKTN